MTSQPWISGTRTAVAVALVLLPFGVSGCGSGTTGESGDSALVFRAIAERAGGADSVNWATKLSDFLPAQQYVIDDSAPRSLGAGVVSGTVTGVSGAGAWETLGDDGDSAKQVSFDAPDADWRTILVQIKVDDANSYGNFPDVLTAEFSLSGDQDYSGVMEGLRSMSTVIAAVDEKGSYELTPDAYPIELEGQALGQIQDGDISFPALGAADTAFVANTKTLRALRREAANDHKPIVIKHGVRESGSE